MPAYIPQSSSVQGVLTANVANGGTVVVPYPSGKIQRSFNAGLAIPGSHYIILDGSSVFANIALTFNAGDITVTNNSGQTWPAGSRYNLNIQERAGNDVTSWQFAIPLAALANGNVITDFRPRFIGTVEQVDLTVTQAGVGAGATALLNWQIDTVALTGGQLNPTLANTTQGAVLAANPTAANRIVRESQLRLVASAVTAFTGGFVVATLHVRPDISNTI